MSEVPVGWVRGMPVWYIYGTGFLEFKYGKKQINLFKGPIYSEQEARKKGFDTFGESFELFKTNTTSYANAKAQWKSQKLDKTLDISDSLQNIYTVKED